MQLSECTIGAVVCEKADYGSGQFGEARIGHIIGLRRVKNKIWPVVRFVDKRYIGMTLEYIINAKSQGGWVEPTNFNHIERFTAY